MTNWKALAIGILIGLVVDIAAAYTLIVVTGSSEGDRLVICLILVAMVWAVQIYVGLKAFAIAALFKHEGSAKNLAAMLSAEGFPPAKAHDTAQRYLDRIIESYDNDRLRLRASFLKGELAGIANGGISRSMTVNKAWDRAIQLIA